MRLALVTRVLWWSRFAFGTARLMQFTGERDSMKSLTDEQRAEIDSRILACDIIGAIGFIRTACECGLNDAKEIHWARYQHLRAERADQFTCNDTQYWAGIYG